MSFLKPKAQKSSSLSENVNNDLLTGIYAPQAQTGVGATNFLAQLLGVSPGTEGQAGFDAYKANAGYAPALQAMQRGVIGGQAAQGLLRSGSTNNALLRKGAELDQQYYNNYLQNLSGLSGLGLQGGGIIANTGQRSTSTGTGSSPSTAGTIASTIGGIASIFSDRRLKTDIRRVGKTKGGLPLYSFRYKAGGPKQIGVMAQDVEKKKPSALGPEVGGFKTVNLDKVT